MSIKTVGLMLFSRAVILILFFLPRVLLAEDNRQAMTWYDCVREAAKNQPALISAVEEIKSGEAAMRVSASGEYPQVSASVSGSLAKNTGRSTSETYGAALSGSQLLFDGKKTINEVNAAAENIRASKENYRYISAGVRKSLRSAFVELMKAQEMINLAREIYGIRRASYELITLRYRSGLEHKGALLTAEANLVSAKYGVDSSSRDLSVARRNLLKELGRSDWSEISVEADFSVIDIPEEGTDLYSIAAKNPQVLKISAQKNAAEFNLRSAYGNFAPSLSVDGSAGKTGTAFWPRDTQKSLGFTLSVPLFEGGSRHAQLAAAQASLNKLRAEEKSAVDGAVASLEQSRAALLEAVDNVAVQEKALLAAQERSAIAEAQYSIGTISFDSWTIIEDNLVSAKRSYLNARVQSLLSEAGWKEAKGETLENEK